MTVTSLERSPTFAPNESLDPTRLRQARKAYTTRFVAAAIDASADGYYLETGADVTPKAGDVVLARVIELGKHKRLESPYSRRSLMFPGQEILVAYGHRYAPDQFLAHVPTSLDPCHLVAAGGVAGFVTERHASIEEPTAIEPLGLLAVAQGRVTLDRFAPFGTYQTAEPALDARPPVIAVLGSSMNSGKSTTLGYLVNGLVNAGLQVAAGKVTGTGAGNDPNLFRDAGAAPVLDFTDFGHPSTFQLSHDRIRHVLTSMVGELSAGRPDAVVIEIADGVYQTETRRLLQDPAFHSHVDEVVFSAQDALGAAAGLQVLDEASIATAAVSGVLTSSPLATREAAAVLDVPVIDTDALRDPDVATSLLPARKLREAR